MSVIGWSLDDVTATSENIEVYAAHMGIGHHPAYPTPQKRQETGLPPGS